MANRKQYYALDDVGFLGVAGKRSGADIKEDAKKTSDYIKILKAGSGVIAVDTPGNASAKRTKAGKGQVAVNASKTRAFAAKSR